MESSKEMPGLRQRVSKQIGRPADSASFMLGLLVYSAAICVATSAPAALPTLFILFVAVALPHRLWSFVQRKWTFFLVDFCYVVNVTVIVHLLWFPQSTNFQALVYALSDGPLACAILLWQCSWVFGSPDHYISVLMHLLPGLAIFGQRYHGSPCGWSKLLTAWGAVAHTTFTPRLDTSALSSSPCPSGVLHNPAFWLLAAPIAFYACWQLLYFLLVQVVFRDFIERNNYDTSYRSMTKRVGKAKSFYLPLLRHGATVNRRVLTFGKRIIQSRWLALMALCGGLFQLTFTVLTLLVVVPLYFSYKAQLMWQVLKVMVALYYGVRYQCEKLPAVAFLAGCSMLDEAMAANSVADSGTEASDGGAEQLKAARADGSALLAAQGFRSERSMCGLQPKQTRTRSKKAR